LAVSSEDDLERLMVAHSPRLQAILQAARGRIQAGQGIPSTEYWKQVGNSTESGIRRKKRAKTA
jgi:hypothetical protein